MNVAIVGSRTGVNEQAVRRFVRSLAQKHPGASVVSGGARGVDSWAEDEARRLDMPRLVYLPDWERFGKSAGFRRNSEIVNAADVVVAFTTGSRGTAHTISLARAAAKPVHVHGPMGERLESPIGTPISTERR
jgi:hypothetical protein